MTKTDYEQDFYTWAKTQAAHVRAKAWHALDVEHVAEELESLGNEQAHAVESHLANLVLHLLELIYQRQRRRGWVQSINNARREIALRLKRNPGLQHDLPDFLAWAYPRARKDATKESRLPLAMFPEACPWTLEQILDEDFPPEGEEVAP
jgi:hypothetical protein